MPTVFMTVLIGDFTWLLECRHWIFLVSAMPIRHIYRFFFSTYLQSKDRSPAQELVCSLHSGKDVTHSTVWIVTVQQMCKLVEAVVKVDKSLKPARTKEFRNCQWCLLFWIEFVKLTFNKWSWNGDGCMVASPHSKVSSLLPGLGDWVPGEDRGEGVEIII